MTAAESNWSDVDKTVIAKTSWVPALGAVLAAVAAASLTIFAMLAQSAFWSPDLRPRLVPLRPSDGAAAIVIPGASRETATAQATEDADALAALLAPTDGPPRLDEPAERPAPPPRSIDEPRDRPTGETSPGARPTVEPADDDGRHRGKYRGHRDGTRSRGHGHGKSEKSRPVGTHGGGRSKDGSGHGRPSEKASADHADDGASPRGKAKGHKKHKRR